MNSVRNLIIVCAAVFIVSITLLIVLSSGRARTPVGPVLVTEPPSENPLLPDRFAQNMNLVPFSLVDQSGAPVTHETLQGRVTVMDFFFTHCTTVCPMMTGRLAALTKELNDPRIQFLSVSVDPQRDTPERLTTYARTFSADTSRWRFLTGDPAESTRLVREGLGFALEDDPSLVINLPDGSTMNNIRHPSHFVLVGPDARVLSVYRYSDEQEVALLVQRARAIAQTLPNPG